MIQSMESMKKDLITTKLKIDNPASTQFLENYENKVKTNRNETQTKCTTDTRSGKRQDETVILTTYCSSRQIRKSEKVSKSEEYLLTYIQTKSYCTLYNRTWWYTS